MEGLCVCREMQPVVKPTLCTFRLPVAQRRGYKNVFDALFRIAKEEGVFTLWRVSYNDMLMSVIWFTVTF